MTYSDRKAMKHLLLNVSQPAHSTVLHLLADDNVLGCFIVTDPALGQPVLYLVLDNPHLGYPSALAGTLGGHLVRCVQAAQLAALVADAGSLPGSL